MGWRNFSTHKEIDLKEYLEKWLFENPDHLIYIGCDSHNDMANTNFATVIVLHHYSKGGHVLYNKEIIPRVTSAHERLWKEVEYSVNAAKKLIEWGIQSPEYIDIDMNPDPKYQSNQMLRAAVGLVESEGMKARYKTLSPWSISIADVICR